MHGLCLNSMAAETAVSDPAEAAPCRLGYMLACLLKSLLCVPSGQIMTVSRTRANHESLLATELTTPIWSHRWVEFQGRTGQFGIIASYNVNSRP